MLVQSEKVLVSFYNFLKNNDAKKFPIEDVAVVVWKDHPNDFCLRGYKEHPDVERIRRVISSLVSDGYVMGNVYGYKITEKGEKYADIISNKKNGGKDSNIIENSIASRKLHAEIERLLASKIYREYSKSRIDGEKLDLLESDFFEFLGTSPRSLSSEKEKKQLFLPKYNFMIKEIIPFCKTNSKDDSNAASLVELWSLLFTKFGKIIDGG